MNLGVEEQAQRRKKDKRRSRKKKNADSEQPIQTNHKKIFKTITMKVQQRKIGLIIGQNGKNIKELYQLTHCDIILPMNTKKRNDEMPDQITEPQWDDQELYYVYDAYNESVDTNVGLNDDQKQNSKKKKDKSKNGDDSEEELDIDDPRRLVEIKLRGSPEEVRDAKVEIEFMIKKGRLMLDHERNPDQKKKHKKHHRNDDDDDEEHEDDEIAQDIRIPSKICGMLIGGGGQRVKELMEDTGCEIWVDWDKDSHIEAGVSTVHLKGTRYSVEFAKEEIRRIQRLFEKGSNNFRFEIPAFASKDLFGENGQNLKQLQMDYNVTVNVKNYRNERSHIRIGDEQQRIQRTVLITLIGEYEDQMACKKGIDKLVGLFEKCQECQNLKKEDDGFMDNKTRNWYCNDCWDEFNGVKKDPLEQQQQQQHGGYGGGGGGGGRGGGVQRGDFFNKRFQNLNMNVQPQQPPPPRPQRPPQHPPQQQRGYRIQPQQQQYQQQPARPQPARPQRPPNQGGQKRGQYRLQPVHPQQGGHRPGRFDDGGYYNDNNDGYYDNRPRRKNKW